MEIIALLIAAFLQLVGLTLEQLHETVAAVKTALVQQYVDATEGARLGNALSDALQRGAFTKADGPEAFAAAIQTFLQAESRDRHLLMWRGAPVDILKIAPGGRLQGPAVGRSEKRADGVGFVEVRHFLNENQGNPAIAAQIDGAMRDVAGAKALVLDVRQNPGGDLSAVAHLATYLFAARTHLLTRALRGRADTIEVWTRDDVPGARLPDVPVYVVTSADTFSAGEAFAFALQKTGRAIVVGERTGGGGYSGTFARLPNGFTMFVSTGRTFDPRSGAGWQVDGVRPDREAPAAQALDVALNLASQAAASRAASNRVFVNGRVFDGERFVDKPLYVTADGVFSSARPAGDEIDLAGGYVIPPFGEGHNHNVDTEPAIDRYLKTGIFYVFNPNTLPRAHSSLPARLNTPAGVDVQLAGGGLTGTGGHPFFVAQRNLDRKTWTQADMDGGFYHAIDSVDDLAKKWPAILAARPDFIKIYLLYSEAFVRRRDDRAFIGWRGLDPALAAPIVARAKASGLRVAAHVETAADFRAAVRGGVDVVAHLPGFRPALTERPFYENLEAHRLSAEDAREAAQRRVTVVTTVSSLLDATERELRGLTATDADAFRALVRNNLSMLKAAGVPIAFGSDTYNVTSEAEVRAIAALGVFSPAELLQMWSVVTPTMIFPRRRIARLEPGYEASFLVLDSDPTRSIDGLFRIRMRIKQGVMLPDTPSK